MATNTDDFNRSDGELAAGSSGNWVALRTGGQTASIASNVLKGDHVNDSPYYYNAVYASSAVYSQFQYVTTAGSSEFSLIINCDTATDGSRDYYQLEIRESGGTYIFEIYEIVNAAAVGGTFLDQVTGVSLSAGDVIRFENDGSGNLSAKINGTPIAGLSATSTSLTHARVGLVTSDTTSARLDNWEGGDVTGGGGGDTRAHLIGGDLVSPALLRTGLVH